MYICQYKCRFCNSFFVGKILTEDNIDEFEIEKYKISNQVLHRTIGHIGLADFVGLEDYESYQLSQLEKQINTQSN